MEQIQALQQIHDACDAMSRELMKINPAIGHLNHKETQDKMYETVYRLTTDVETVKKAMLKLRNADDSSDL